MSTSAQLIRSQLVPDDVHGRHFGHHPHFRERYAGAMWRYDYIQVAFDQMICRYPQIGDSAICPGVMAGVGEPRDSWEGTRISEMAGLFRSAAMNARLDFNNTAVRKVLAFLAAGPEAMYKAEQPLVFDCQPAGVFVVEGNHRCLALGILGAKNVTGVDWKAIEIRRADEDSPL